MLCPHDRYSAKTQKPHKSSPLRDSRSHLQAARTNVEEAIAIIEQLRTKIDSKKLRTSYFATQHNDS